MPSPLAFRSCPITPEQISCIIGELMKNYVGTYTYSDGQTRPAVSINKPMENKYVTGIEIIIAAAPISTGRESSWTIYCLDKSPSEVEGKLGLISQEFRTLFNEGIDINYIAGDKTIEAIPQLRIDIPLGFLMLLRVRMGIDPELGLN